MSTVSEPFVGLRPFDYDEGSIFFGRAREIEALTNLVCSSDVVLVHAPSGVGKSSLLRAGLSATLSARRGMAVTACRDWHPDAMREIWTMLESSGIGRSTRLLDSLRKNYEATGERTVLILDQMEELIRVAEDLDSVWESLAPIANAGSTAAALVLSIRDDYLGALDGLLNRVPGLMDSRFRVPPLKREALELAVRGPLALLHPPCLVEEKLLGTVIDDLQSGPTSAEPDLVEPGYFQIVWSRLWEVGRVEPDHTLHLALYEAEGKGYEIVRVFMHRAIDGALEPKERQLFYAMARYLVLPTGAKVAMSVADLVGLIRPEDFTELARTDPVFEVFTSPQRTKDSADANHVVADVLRGLSTSSVPVLRRGERGTRVQYELVHDLLGTILLEWREKFAFDCDLALRESTTKLSSEQVDLRVELEAKLANGLREVDSENESGRRLAVEELSYVALRGGDIFPDLASAAVKALDRVRSDETSVEIKRNAERVVAASRADFSTEAALRSSLSVLRRQTLSLRTRALSGLFWLFLAFFSQTIAAGFSRGVFVSVFGDEPFTNPQLIATIIAILIWWGVYLYDALDNYSPARGALREVLVASPRRPAVMGTGLYERLATWPLNFVLPAVAADALGYASRWAPGNFSIWYCVFFALASIVMLCSYNSAAVLVV